MWEYTRAHRLDRHVARSSDDRIWIVCAGKTYFDVVEALTSLGLDLADLSRHGIRLLKIGMIWPLDPQVITEFADGLQEIIVVEEKRSFLEAAVKEILYGRAGSPVVLGKTDDKGRGLSARSASLDSDAVSRALARRLGEVHRIEPVLAWREQPATTRTSLQLLTRTPYFCSGCPHNASTQVPDGSVVGAGIGCHGMVLLMDEKQTGRVIGLTQMGGEGAQWLGMAPSGRPGPLHPERRRRHVHSLRQPCPPRRRRVRREHHLQDLVQLHGRDDRRPGPGRRLVAAAFGAAASRRGRQQDPLSRAKTYDAPRRRGCRRTIVRDLSGHRRHPE